MSLKDIISLKESQCNLAGNLHMELYVNDESIIWALERSKLCECNAIFVELVKMQYTIKSCHFASLQNNATAQNNDGCQ